MAESQMTLMGRQSIASDLSGGMVNKVGKAKEAALQFFKTGNPQDEFFLVTFSDHAQLTSTFTSNVEDLASRMLSTSAKGRTALLDAIYLGLTQMSRSRDHDCSQPPPRIRTGGFPASGSCLR
jgi:Mg-chelatase subunit ChlD